MLTVYSADGSPGASTTAMYLAAQWASTGTAVLLVEADPAGGSLSHNLGIQFTPGSASFVAAGLTVKAGDLIDHSQDVLFNSLHIMPSTSSPTGAREITKWFAERGDALRAVSEEDMAVVVDGGRLLAEPAAAGLALAATGIVVVTRDSSDQGVFERIGGSLTAEVCGESVERCVITIGDSPFSEAEWRERYGLSFRGSIIESPEVSGDLSAFLARNRRKSKRWRGSLEDVAERLLPLAKPPPGARRGPAVSTDGADPVAARHEAPAHAAPPPPIPPRQPAPPPVAPPVPPPGAQEPSVPYVEPAPAVAAPPAAMAPEQPAYGAPSSAYPTTPPQQQQQPQYVQAPQPPQAPPLQPQRAAPQQAQAPHPQTQQPAYRPAAESAPPFDHVQVPPRAGYASQAYVPQPPQTAPQAQFPPAPAYQAPPQDHPLAPSPETAGHPAQPPAYGAPGSVPPAPPMPPQPAAYGAQPVPPYAPQQQQQPAAPILAQAPPASSPSGGPVPYGEEVPLQGGEPQPAGTVPELAPSSGSFRDWAARMHGQETQGRSNHSGGGTG